MPKYSPISKTHVLRGNGDSGTLTALPVPDLVRGRAEDAGATLPLKLALSDRVVSDRAGSDRGDGPKARDGARDGFEPLLLTDQVTGATQEQLAESPADPWIVSDWPAAQSSRTLWSPDNVTFHADGDGFDLTLSRAPDGSSRPIASGEVATAATASEGTWEWQVQLPDMVSGTVFGMFLFQADPTQPRLEFDIEFVGSDTTELEINIHMQDEDGQMHRLLGGPRTIGLPFDAAEGVHSYTITVEGEEAVFLADGVEIGRFGPDDMPEGVWRTGEMRAYTDLWAVSPGGQEYWAGAFAYPGTPLVAQVVDMNGPGDALPLPPDDGTITGTAGADDLFGTADDDRIDGRDGDDAIYAGAGNDSILGGAGDDRIALDKGYDVIDGGAGEDWLFVTAKKGAQIDLSQSGPQSTGSGTDRITGIEHVLGGRGKDWLAGDAQANRLDGGAGNDTLRGGAGDDTLTGGEGRDSLWGGPGADVFVFRSAADSPLRRGDIVYGFSDEDRIDLTGLGTFEPLAFGNAASAYGIWTDEVRNGTQLVADTDGDARGDLQVTFWQGFVVDASHLIL